MSYPVNEENAHPAPPQSEFVKEHGEKTSLGSGTHNEGVTSADQEEKEEIEKHGSLAQLPKKSDE